MIVLALDDKSETIVGLVREGSRNFVERAEQSAKATSPGFLSIGY
jgi:hypothetical protein